MSHEVFNLKQAAEHVHLDANELRHFAQRGEMDDVSLLRGGYAEKWTVFWLTAHFLNAAAQFAEMGVSL